MDYLNEIYPKKTISVNPLETISINQTLAGSARELRLRGIEYPMTKTKKMLFIFRNFAVVGFS